MISGVDPGGIFAGVGWSEGGRFFRGGRGKGQVQRFVAFLYGIDNIVAYCLY